MQAWISLRVFPLSGNTKPVEFVGFVDTLQPDPRLLTSFSDETAKVAEAVEAVVGNSRQKPDSD